jgi:hypothetical protein
VDRAHILDEARRLAAENGGKPVGYKRFMADTGISRHAWGGKYWRSYAEMLQEAGLDPNTFLIPAYPDDELLGRLATLTRQNGAVPTQAAILYARQSDPTFPGERAFRRLGSKQARIKRLMDYCTTTGGLDDVSEICARELKPDEPEPTTDDDRTRTEDRFVYMLKSGKYHKVGQSNDVGRRAYEIRLQQPEPVVEVHKIKTDDPEGIEAYWHNRFKAQRVGGEWFRLSAADVKAFKRRRFM